MESSETFGQEIGSEDPFAGSDFGDWEQEQEAPPAPSQEDSSPPAATSSEALDDNPNVESGYDGPVAAEGEVSPNHPAHPRWHQDMAPAEGARYREEHGEPPAPATVPSPAASVAPPPAVDTPAAPSPAPSPPAAPQAPSVPLESEEAGRSADETVAEPAPAPAQQAATPADGVQAPPEPQNGAESVAQEAVRRDEEGDVPIDTGGLPEPPQADGDGATTATGTSVTIDIPSEAPAADPEEIEPEPEGDATLVLDPDEAPQPEETKDKRGRVTHRRYVILRHEGGHRFLQLQWYEDKKQQIVQKGTPNSKRQTVVLARGTEDALKFGYAVTGGPQEGIDLVAVAAAYFQVKHVAPEPPPPPIKQRLRIN